MNKIKQVKITVNGASLDLHLYNPSSNVIANPKQTLTLTLTITR